MVGFFFVASMLAFFGMLVHDLRSGRDFYPGWGPFGRAFTVSGWVVMVGFCIEILAASGHDAAAGFVVAPLVFWQVFTSNCWKG